jgi:hypothetical protein
MNSTTKIVIRETANGLDMANEETFACIIMVMMMMMFT